MRKIYIGDSVYAEIMPAPFVGFELVLTTENGLPGDPSNRIVLGAREWQSLTEYVEHSLTRDTAAEVAPEPYGPSPLTTLLPLVQDDDEPTPDPVPDEQPDPEPTTPADPPEFGGGESGGGGASGSW